MQTKTEKIPQDLKALDRWVGRDENVAYYLRLPSKTPLCVYAERAASVSDPITWGTFEEAEECVEKCIYDHIGFVFADDGYVGIDIDKGVAFEGGFPSHDALEAIHACKSYTELSQSNRAFHIICKGDLPFNGKNNGHGWEIYKGKRYFVLTGNVLFYDRIEDAQEGIDLVLAKHFAEEIRERPKSERQMRIWEARWEPPHGGKLKPNPTREPVPQGARHISMVSFCGQMKSALMHKSMILKEALKANETYMRPPLPEAEIVSIVESLTRGR